ncbi:VOC family protein [Pararoseomonas indoligenes]|uniref:VOC family protein n=1 Tax=Roseomonas indoligenes TaxID=2820811 RepID=A0A940MZS8_9PROT|nr:VOC family protein [Pararoseomonas indoligenes]MBP0494070.1 VOC family protein [Pararoseomonas indoligenes]
MLDLGLTILLVDSPEASAAFYAALLGREPVEASPTFALFVTPGGRIALWSRHTVEPVPGAAAGGAELAFMVEDVDATHAAWAARGIRILMPPKDLDFGRSALALDPDGHRLRAYRLSGK